MKLTKRKTEKINNQGRRDPRILEGPVMSIYSVKLSQIEAVTGLTKKEFQQREKSRSMTSKDGTEYKLPPVWRPLYKKHTKPERGRGTSWKFTFSDLASLYVLNQARDMKTGFQKALCSFMLREAIYAERDSSSPTPMSDNFKDFATEYHIKAYGFPLIKSHEEKSTTSEHGELSKKVRFKMLYQFHVTKNHKPVMAWTFLVHDDTYYRPLTNDDPQKCQMEKILNLKTGECCMTITFDLNEANRAVKENIRTQL